MGVEVSGGPFVTVVSVDGGSLLGNKLTVRTPAPSPISSSHSDSPEPVTLLCTSPVHIHHFVNANSPAPLEPTNTPVGGGAYVTVLALGKEKEGSHGENTSVVNILNEVEECLKENFPEFLPLLEVKRKTVVSIEDLEEDLIIYRLPGERLGFALRFEGGENPSQTIDRLFIDSCTEDSPAGKAAGSWGPLVYGDEVLAIDGFPVSLYTRQQLIDTLRESSVALTLRVRHVLTHTPITEPLPIIIPSEDETTSEQLLNQLTETLPLLQESLLSSDWSEPIRTWSPLEDECPIPPARRLTTRDSMKYYRNQRPLSLHLELDPPEGFEDFQLRLRTLSLESLPSSLMRSRSSLGHLDPPLEPPLSFQDPCDGWVGTLKKVVARSRSLVNISHEEVEPDHPEEMYGDEEEDESREGDIELDACVEELDRSCVSPDLTQVEDRSEASGSGSNQSGSGDDGEVTIRIEWLHEIQEEQSSLPVLQLPFFEEETITSDVEDFQLPNSVDDESHNLGLLPSSIDTTCRVREDSVNIEGTHLPLDTIQLDQHQQNSTVSNLPIKDYAQPLIHHSLSTIITCATGSTGMDTTLDFDFLPLPTHARQPPDGHESPNNVNNNWAEQNYTPPPLPDSQPPEDDPPPLPTSGPPNAQIKTFCRISTSDEPDSNSLEEEPSIKSVKDKIALFSSSSMMEESSKFPLQPALSESLNNNAQEPCNLLEERRKSICRLRGMVLVDKPILDLPTIRSKDAPLITSIIPKVSSKTPPLFQSQTQKSEASAEVHTSWRASASLPKYSPAFKRRTLAPYVPPKPQPRPPNAQPPQCRPLLHSSTSLEDLTNSAHTDSTVVENGKEVHEESESDKDSAVPSSPPSSLPQEITPPNSPFPVDEGEDTDRIQERNDPILNIGGGEQEKAYEDFRDFVQQSPLQAIFDMEAQMAYINEICDALPMPSGGEFFHKRRDSEATVIERPVSVVQSQQTVPVPTPPLAGVEEIDKKTKERETKSPAKEFQATCNETPRTLQGTQNHTQANYNATADKVLLKVTGILEKKIERIIEKTSTESRVMKSSTTSIPRGRNDFKSLAEKWQQISTQEKSKSVDMSANCITSKSPFTPVPHARTTRALSVTDIRKTFEKSDGDSVDSSISSTTQDGKGSPPELLSPPSAHFRVSSFDSTTSEESSTPGTSFISSVPRDPYGSITSLASSTSLISPQELQQLIEEANQSLEEAGTPTHEVNVVILHRDFPGGSLGITLAGGADYETKEITVHKVLSGSIADRDGRICRGDRVLSLNGKNTRGLTHREALNLLKAPRCEVVLVVSRGRTGTNSFSTIDETTASLDRAVEPLLNLNGTIPIPPTYENDEDTLQIWGSTKTVILVKDGAGLGFSLDGGKGSILGDRPLTIKKIFVGGPAEKCRGLAIGDLITGINGTKMSSKSRTEAWNFMKKLGDGEVRVTVRSPIQS